MSIQVSSSYMTASAYLNQLRGARCKFLRPNFKSSSSNKNDLPSLKLAAKLRGEEFEQGKGKEIHSITMKVVSETKGWDRIMGNGINISNKNNSTKDEEKKSALSKLTQEAKEKAKIAEESRKRRVKAATIIQKHGRRVIAIERCNQIRREEDAAHKIQGLYFKWLFNRKKIIKGLDRLRQHFFASVITRFMRDTCEILATRRCERERNEKIRGMFSGIKTRMILELPRMKDIRNLIIKLLEELDNPTIDAFERNSIVDDLKYQKNLYSNIFNRFWKKKLSALEEVEKEKEKDRKKKISLSNNKKPNYPGETMKSKLSSRRQSSESFEGGNRPIMNPDDRPIKPMSGSFGAFGSNDSDIRSSSLKNFRSRSKKDKKKFEDSEVSDKVRMQRELVEKRTKYDPRKALSLDKSPSTGHLNNNKRNPSKDNSSQKKTNRSKNTLGDIQENLSEDRSGIMGMDGMYENEPRVKKEFLKRKTKKVEFHKLDWSKVERRIDCWVPNSSVLDKKEEKPKIKTPRSHHQKSFASPSITSLPNKDLDSIKLKNQPKRKDGKSQSSSIIQQTTQKKDKDSLKQIENTLNNNYIPKLKEIFTKELTVKAGSKIPTVDNNSRYIYHIDTTNPKDILHELEEEYEYLVNM